MQKDNIDDRLATCLKTVRIKKQIIITKGQKNMNRQEQIEALQKDWQDNPRWSNVKRTYGAEDVVRLRGSVQPECTYA